MPAAQPVTTSAELLQALERLTDADFVALDTEFMRESTYFPKLCLVQVATPAHCVLIDPLAVPDLQPLWNFLNDRARTKVLHAARQDLEVLSVAMRGALNGPIFDTQIAAALLGQPAQIGYGALVAARLGQQLEKGHTRTDWSRRPLSPEQLQYAEDDVRYLVPLYLNLRDALEEAGRTPWLFEETRELELPSLHRTEPEAAWKRLKGLDRLRPEQRATAKLLAHWREETAIKHDKPRGWILADDALREIAERLPGSIQDLENIRTLPGGIARRRGDELVALVARGIELGAGEPASFVPPRPEPQQLAMVTKLMNIARTTAEELKVSPEILATRRDVEQLVFSRRTDRLSTGWRKDVIGDRLIAGLQGAT
ncbi:ribonuclease D [Steroidobacter sp. S1-65]|uniref:Ribonuclease D n=1 Tax=Steroidobacter gossypii TaxID=2805490 RepID=A0ABS1X3X3_9GAMM|nr:ribonuclease D [Steroidobacter gossypii]MBM0107924.1 ribonuclease D [Steroidobacter gossypii]